MEEKLDTSEKIKKKSNPWIFFLLFIKRFHRKELFLLFVAIIVGLVVGGASVGLKYVIEKLLEVSLQAQGEKIIHSLAGLSAAQIIMVPAFGGLFVGIMRYHVFRSGVRGGVEQVMQSLATKQGYLGKREVIEKFITSAITLGTGGSAGKEGPVVHIGGGIGSIIGRLFHLPDEYVKALVGSGAAAGIAAAFNAPIAGTFFAMEILLGDISLNIVSMILVSAISATMVGRFFQGEHPAFSPPIYEVTSPLEFIFFLFLGVLAGYVCILFIKSLIFSKDRFLQIKLPQFLKPAIGGFFVGVIALFIPHILGIGYGTIDNLLRFENHLVTFQIWGIEVYKNTPYYAWFLLLIIAAILIGKIVATSITIGSGGVGGTIIPAIFLGAALGALVGHFANIIFPASNIPVGAFALIGMGSILAGTTQAPIMAILLIFETTRSYQIILPVAIVSILASQIVKYHLHGSMYILELRHLGISLYEGIEKNLMSTIRVEDIMRTNLLTVPDNMPLRQIMEIFLHTRFTTVIVTNSQKEIVGKLHLDDLKRLVETPYLYNVLIASEIMEETEMIAMSEPLTKAVDILTTKHSSLIPVVEKIGGKIAVGYITRKDILNLYQKEILKKSISGISFRSPVAEMEANPRRKQHSIDFSEDYMVQTIFPDASMVNKSLKDLQLRQQYGVTILAVFDEEDDRHIVPTPDYEIKKNDNLVIAGRKQSVESLINSLHSKHKK